MKKVFGLMLAMSFLVLLSGCDKEVEEKISREIYAKSYIEEIGGEDVEITNVVIFNEDGTGTIALQDVIPFTYDSKTMSYEDGTLMYNYTIEGPLLSLMIDDNNIEFTKVDESILEKIPDIE